MFAFPLSQNSGFGESLSNVSNGLSCVVDSENPQHWAEAIKNVRHKSSEIRYKECETLRMHYDEKCNWEKQCTELVDIIFTKAQGNVFNL